MAPTRLASGAHADAAPNRAERRHPERLASRREVADFLGLPQATLTAWAYKRVGPRYRLVGRHARYAWGDVEMWLANQAAGGAA